MPYESLVSWRLVTVAYVIAGGMFSDTEKANATGTSFKLKSKHLHTKKLNIEI